MSGVNYAKGKPMGNNQIPFYDSPPAVKAIVSRISENATASSVITMTPNTTALEITTQGTVGLIRWVLTSDSEASVFGNASIMNYDHAIPANTVRRFVVPIEGQYAEGQGSMVGTNIANALFRRFAWKTQGIASVLSNEYGSSNSY